MLYLSDCNTIQHGETNSFMSTQCNTNQLEFLPFKSSESNERTRRVLGRFDADKVSSDGAMVLLRVAEHRFGIIRRLSECFTDLRDPRYINHPLFSIVVQRVLAICLGVGCGKQTRTLRREPRKNLRGLFRRSVGSGRGQRS